MVLSLNKSNLVSIINVCLKSSFFFFFNYPATPEISPLPLHDALPISEQARPGAGGDGADGAGPLPHGAGRPRPAPFVLLPDGDPHRGPRGPPPRRLFRPDATGQHL